MLEHGSGSLHMRLATLRRLGLRVQIGRRHVRLFLSVCQLVILKLEIGGEFSDLFRFSSLEIHAFFDFLCLVTYQVPDYAAGQRVLLYGQKTALI